MIVRKTAAELGKMRRSGLLVIVEVDVDVTPLLLPRPDSPAPVGEYVGAIVPLVVSTGAVAPDVEVEFDPKAVRAGRDPQLEKAVEIVLARLKESPVKHPARPPFPDYYTPGAKNPAEGK